MERTKSQRARNGLRLHVFRERENTMSRGGREEEGYPRRELQRICNYRVHTSAAPLPEQAGEMQIAAPHLSWSL